MKLSSLHAVSHLDLQNHNITVFWHGETGMVWEDVEATITSITEQRGHPDWVILRCGGNSIGTMPFANAAKVHEINCC